MHLQQVIFESYTTRFRRIRAIVLLFLIDLIKTQGQIWVQPRGKKQIPCDVCRCYLQPVARETQGVRRDTLRFGRYKPLWGTGCFHLHCIYSTLKMDIAWSSEVVVSFFQTTRRHTPENSSLLRHSGKNFKSYKIEGVTSK